MHESLNCTVPPRLTYLDLIRTVAMFCILIIHYNATVSAGFVLPTKIFSNTVFGTYLGAFGVILFLIVSGAALMYTSPDAFSVKEFYKKRFFAIYPAFWCCWIVAFLFAFFLYKTVTPNAPTWTVIFTLFGVDSYLLSLGFMSTNFYLVGEWFIGCILCIYLIYPLLLHAIRKKPVFLGIIIGIVLLASCHIDKIFLRYVPAFVFGMYFICYIKRTKWQVALGCLVILVILQLFPTMNFPQAYREFVAGTAAFYVLAFVGSYLQRDCGVSRIINHFCKICCKYSYEVFLVHHFLIASLSTRFDLNAMQSLRQNLTLFTLYLVLTAFCAYLLKKLTTAVQNTVMDMAKCFRCEQ